MQEKGVEVLDAPVGGGPDGAKSGKMAIWVGGDEATFDKYKSVLDSMGDAARYIGPIGTGSITAKLVHNLSGYILGSALAETFTMGVKAGLEPDALGSGSTRRIGTPANIRHHAPEPAARF